MLDRNGRLPWRLAEIQGRLRRSFEDFGRGSSNAVSNSVLFAAIASHYVQDAHQPLHATDNYDGQLTGQRGMHSRFERELFERFQSRLKIVPAAPVPMLNARDTAFDVLLASYQQVEPSSRPTRTLRPAARCTTTRTTSGSWPGHSR